MKKVASEIKSYQEHIFVLLMIALVFLYRENPLLSFPELPILLVGLLGYNLVQHWYLPRSRRPQIFHAFSIVVNSLFITGIIHYSGGADSSLWVLLLLPIFSACIMQEPRTIWLALVLAVTILGVFYIDLVFNPTEPQLFALGTKLGVLILSMVVTMRLALSERQAKEAMETQRDSLNKIVKEAEASTIQLDKMASLGQLASSIAHDLNGPIAVILGYTDMLLTELDPQSKHGKDLERIREAAQFCRNLVSEILGLARREDYQIKPTSIQDIFDRSWRLCEAQFRRQQVSLVRNLDEGDQKVPMSPLHIEQVILNLLTNAAHVSSPGGTVKVMAKKVTAKGKASLAVSVKDTGAGIPTEVLPKLFTAFFTTKSKGVGTGMGLHICKQIIERHQGHISAENSPEGGAVFTFTLPMS